MDNDKRLDNNASIYRPAPTQTIAEQVKDLLREREIALERVADIDEQIDAIRGLLPGSEADAPKRGREAKVDA